MPYVISCYERQELRAKNEAYVISQVFYPCNVIMEAYNIRSKPQRLIFYRFEIWFNMHNLRITNTRSDLLVLFNYLALLLGFFHVMPFGVRPYQISSYKIL